MQSPTRRSFVVGVGALAVGAVMSAWIGLNKDSHKLRQLPHSLTLQPSDLAENGYDTREFGYNVSSPFAVANIRTSARTLDILVNSNLFATYPQFSQINVRVNGVDYVALQVTEDYESRLSTDLPEGDKTIQIVAGTQMKPDKYLLGTFLVSVAADEPMELVAPQVADHLVVYGDSIAVGANSEVPARDAWPILLRATQSSVMVEGWGYRSLFEDCGTPAQRTQFVSRLTAYAPSKIWIAIGTNDHGRSLWSAEDFGDAYAALLDDLHAVLPETVIYCQTPIARADESANELGNTLGDYRKQIELAQAERQEYSRIIDGTKIMATLDSDGIHPTTEGHAAYAAAVEAMLKT